MNSYSKLHARLEEQREELGELQRQITALRQYITELENQLEPSVVEEIRDALTEGL